MLQEHGSKPGSSFVSAQQEVRRLVASTGYDVGVMVGLLLLLWDKAEMYNPVARPFLFLFDWGFVRQVTRSRRTVNESSKLHGAVCQPSHLLDCGSCRLAPASDPYCWTNHSE